MELAMRFTSNDKILRSNKVQNLKDFTSQSLSTQAKKGEQLVSMMIAFNKALELMGDDIVELSIENESIKNTIGSHDEQCLEESQAKLLKHIDDGKRANLIMSGMEKQMKKQYYLGFISYDKLWQSEFCYNVSAKGRVQDVSPNQIKLKVNYTYKKDEKITTNSEASDDSDILNEAYLATELCRTGGRLSIIEKNLLNLNCVTTNTLKRF